ncbi:bifunctional UDP-N-acetylglucosamine diphosphorylase/glucosamine-1-phosphate N-acetyltransferase GlmU [Wenzhouxiangella marina]|uniref:Bifunctional protein GlmU n=2 Tax=Wenzhouxiangella marina TaxID=1579979 RepID=A0A0K0XZ24_9GAMM|nr:bifunctional UDP-N-acetylglucosamine diphosphorylase/glucosamine-1-phosphate N-acetyltransferase GlmU [Wenzhouxiangella marina]AKS42939.1 bifunctional N-acetylglucosamine-1-phosphate uridyltransferase/glucosamine-1-phosphate acetyltransferase [Wenzhouxiangella marina]
MLHIVILAAGEGRRMNSSRPKVLQPIGGRPMLDHLLDTVQALSPERVHVVVGAGGEQVQAALAGRDCDFVTQAERLGTGHAAQQALPGIDPQARVLVLPGDMPLVRASTLQALLAVEAELALLSFRADDPTGYGRILRDAQGQVQAIREEKDASEAERRVDEVNSGVLVASASRLIDWLGRVRADNAQGEYYLTDCIGLAAGDGARVEALVADDAGELQGANDRAQLAELEAVFQGRARQALMAAGATLAAPDTVQIRGQVGVGRDVFIDANVTLVGAIELGDGVQIGPGCVLEDSQLAAGTCLKPYSVLEGATTTGACTIGPFARLRAGTVLARDVKIGNFVETKKASFAAGAKASHLSYIGDAEVGAEANLGAGTITCNYDGVNKHRTVIGERAFVGSNSALVAPVEVGAEATVGAGTVLTRRAPDGELTVARARQRTVADWKRPTPKTAED